MQAMIVWKCCRVLVTSWTWTLLEAWVFVFDMSKQFRVVVVVLFVQLISYVEKSLCIFLNPETQLIKFI